MNATAKGIDVERAASACAHRIKQELAADEPQLKELYVRRQADDASAKAWETAKLGRDRALELQRRLLQLARQAAALRDLEVTLSSEECALFAYAENT